MQKSELDYVKDYFNIYKFLKTKNDREVVIINLLSAIEELSKFIYVSLLRYCGIKLLGELLEKYGITAFHKSIKRVNSDLENLYKEHEFKYYFFLFFSSQMENKEAVPNINKISEETKEIAEIRKVYLSNIEENKRPEEKIIQLSNELEQKRNLC